MNNSRDVKATIHGDYAIVFNPTGAAEGQLRDAFSIHQAIEGNPNWRVTVHERNLANAAPHPTEQAARDNAMKLAREWIDAQPS